MKVGSPLKMKRKYEVDELHWLVIHGRRWLRTGLFELRRSMLTLKWKRVPRLWEIQFIDRMRAVEKQGFSFDEILKTTLPQLFGDDTSHVLRSWIGRRARANPERFTLAVSRMFGKSAGKVLAGVDSLTNPERMLERKAPQEPPYKSLVEAIERADQNAALLTPGQRELTIPLATQAGDEVRMGGPYSSLRDAP